MLALSSVIRIFESTFVYTLDVQTIVILIKSIKVHPSSFGLRCLGKVGIKK